MKTTRLIKSIFSVVISTFILLGALAAQAQTQAVWLSQLLPLNDAILINTPGGDHSVIIKALQSAKTQIQMSMYHLTDPVIIDTLIAKQAQGVHVQIILDFVSLKTAHYQDTFKRLQAGHVDVVASSSMFHITHSKTFIVDSKFIFISTMNLVGHFDNMRDYGMFTQDASIIREVQSVFNADLANAKNHTMLTPPVQHPNLVWSPINSEQKIVDMLDASKRSIELTTENLGDINVANALIRASGRGVKIRIITPECDLTNNPWRNYPFMREMAQHGVNFKIMPAPSTPALPYMHAKTIVTDQNRLFLGSENLSDNSLLFSRELGVIFTNTNAIRNIEGVFEKDWSVAVAVPSINPSCPPMN